MRGWLGEGTWGGDCGINDDDSLTLHGAVRFCGWLNLWTDARLIRRAVRSGFIDGKKVGGRWRIDRESLRRWVRNAKT